MKNLYLRITLLLSMLLPGSLAMAQLEPPRPSIYTVQYDIRYMDLHAAEVLAWDQCAQKERCVIRASGVSGDSTKRGAVAIEADNSVHEKFTRALAREDAAPRTQNFQLLLLAASTKAGSPGTEVPANAQKALSDLKGFLPFKGYELLDTAWVRATQDEALSARLVGRQGAQHQVQLRFRNTGTKEDRSLYVDGFSLRAEPFSPPPAAGGEKQPARPGRSLIETAFSLKEGETIVVGTSKVDGGDEALVLLLTAVPVG
jgi:hypothetical protein